MVLGLLPAIAAALFFTQLGGIYQQVSETCSGDGCGWLARPLVAVNAVTQAAIACAALLLVTRRRPSFPARLALVVFGAPVASAVVWYLYGLLAQAS